MKNRIIYGFLGIVFSFFFFLIDNFLISSLFFTFFSIILVFELGNLFNFKKIDFFFSLIFISIFLIIQVVFFYCGNEPHKIFTLAKFTLIIQFISYSVYLILVNAIKDSLLRTANLTFVSFYIIFIFYHLIKVKYFYWFTQGLANPSEKQSLIQIYYIIFPFAISWIGDASAYFGGKLLGKKKMNIKTSPNKTIVGFIFNILTTPLAFYLFKGSIILFSPEVLNLTIFSRSFGWAILLCFILGMVGLCGDLIASLHKRSANVKDSGNFLKGHGGLYDRIDSTILVVVFFYYFIYFLRDSPL